ncbi:Ferredoxin-2, mitochondrial [Hondaea fermentalgiana]|uniref:Ferredoxin-2, mitochondrial n=1 Tax=Hondaea fermentalgiana TaxID=2315210 RepID=A0A2R5G3S1_9STRA|nr:Ferredoxin-2, mitochondrial [Hondaea fermentalgiana]|eukprot:GBG25687.1 Ferredoxin-2, mitochondrial [Hondaea fermentalgiana]
MSAIARSGMRGGLLAASALGRSAGAGARTWAAQGVRTMASGPSFEPTSSSTYAKAHDFKPGDAPPSIAESVVKFTLIDEDNKRVEVAGLVGESLTEAAARFKFEDLKDDLVLAPLPLSRKVTDLWTEDIFGDGIQSFQTHVLVPPKYQHLMPPVGPDEDKALSNMDALGRGPRLPESRIGASIFLTKEMEGVEIYVPDPFPADIP